MPLPLDILLPLGRDVSLSSADFIFNFDSATFHHLSMNISAARRRSVFGIIFFAPGEREIGEPIRGSVLLRSGLTPIRLVTDLNWLSRGF